jgi:guanine deaminase
MNKKQLSKMKTILLELAENNKEGFPFSACIEYKKHFYFAVNHVTSKNDPTAHAEIEAIRLACKEAKVPELQNGIIYSSGDPCPMCLTACAWAEIKLIYYVNDYTVATSNNYYYDRPSKEVNKFLNLKRNIREII